MDTRERYINALLGIRLRRIIKAHVALFAYASEYRELKKQKAACPEFPLSPSYPCLGDKGSESGVASGHYFHQDLLVAQSIFSQNPEKHVDVGSRVDGFVAHVASYRPIEVFDIRPLKSDILNISFKQGDIMDTSKIESGYCDSLSCLHALEHFGLGRYGDPIDINGHLKGFQTLDKMLKPGGALYLSVPIGPQRIEFNAHRVFSVAYLLQMFRSAYQVTNFSYVSDDGNLHKDVILDNEKISQNYGCLYGCGMFALKKMN